jgi:hypothetical protein
MWCRFHLLSCRIKNLMVANIYHARGKKVQVDFSLGCKESLRTHANGIDCLTWFLAPNLLGFFNSYSVNKQGFLEWNFLILWWILLMFSSLQDTHRFGIAVLTFFIGLGIAALIDWFKNPKIPGHQLLFKANGTVILESVILGPPIAEELSSFYKDAVPFRFLLL